MTTISSLLLLSNRYYLPSICVWFLLFFFAHFRPKIKSKVMCFALKDEIAFNRWSTNSEWVATINCKKKRKWKYAFEPLINLRCDTTMTQEKIYNDQLSFCVCFLSNNDFCDWMNEISEKNCVRIIITGPKKKTLINLRKSKNFLKKKKIISNSGFAYNWKVFSNFFHFNCLLICQKFTIFSSFFLSFSFHFDICLF